MGRPLASWLQQGWSASQGDGDGPGISLGDGQTEVPGVPVESGRSDMLLRCVLPYLTLPYFKSWEDSIPTSETCKWMFQLMTTGLTSPSKRKWGSTVMQYCTCTTPGRCFGVVFKCLINPNRSRNSLIIINIIKLLRVTSLRLSMNVLPTIWNFLCSCHPVLVWQQCLFIVKNKYVLLITGV